MASKRELIGHGWWLNDHITAAYIDSDAAEDEFIRSYKLRISLFPCKKCRRHATRYMKDHKIEAYKRIKDAHGRYIGMFTYTWEFHNAVNKRLGKPIISFNDAYAMYRDAAPCTACT